MKQRAPGDTHVRNVRVKKTQGAISQFLLPQTSPEADMVMRFLFYSILCPSVPVDDISDRVPGL